ncbi:MAG TPA: Rid family detoxifying hydrolase [Spirochaetia bacterium]|nr:Rid family detoxifying hydrolase [Spirochaetia bacterium]
MKEIVKTDGAPAPVGPYSQGVVAGKLLFVAGQTPKDPRTGQIPQDFKAQVEQCLRNIQAIVTAAGATLADVVKVNAYLKDLGQFKAFNEVYERVFQAPYPARTTVGADLPGIAVEIDAIAVLPG